jgi:hypothetical protein
MLQPPPDFFDRSGPLPPSFDDVRRFPRFYCRSITEATIHPLRKGQAPTTCTILTRDLSRSGLSLVHEKQLFPGQLVELKLNGQPRQLEVVWCKRQELGSYLIGCRFVGVDPDSGGRGATDAPSSEAAL